MLPPAEPQDGHNFRVPTTARETRSGRTHSLSSARAPDGSCQCWSAPAPPSHFLMKKRSCQNRHLDRTANYRHAALARSSPYRAPACRMAMPQSNTREKSLHGRAMQGSYFIGWQPDRPTGSALCRQLAQHILQDATILEIGRLAVSIDPGQQVDCLAAPIGKGKGPFDRHTGFNAIA